MGTTVTTMAVYSVFEFEKTLVLWWHTAMPVEGVNECVALGERMMLRGKVSFLTLIDAGVDLKAPPEARRGIADFLARNDKRIAAAAIVYGAAGFKASALRSIITAINLASRATFPSKVFAETEQGLNWLGEQTGMPPLSAQRLLHACKQRQSQLAS